MLGRSAPACLGRDQRQMTLEVSKKERYADILYGQKKRDLFFACSTFRDWEEKATFFCNSASTVSAVFFLGHLFRHVFSSGCFLDPAHRMSTTSRLPLHVCASLYPYLYSTTVLYFYWRTYVHVYCTKKQLQLRVRLHCTSM